LRGEIKAKRINWRKLIKGKILWEILNLGVYFGRWLLVNFGSKKEGNIDLVGGNSRIKV